MKKEKLSGADRRWGYRFGCDGLISINEATRLLNICRTTLYTLFEDGKIRRGKIREKVVVCNRSIREFLNTIEV